MKKNKKKNRKKELQIGGGCGNINIGHHGQRVDIDMAPWSSG